MLDRYFIRFAYSILTAASVKLPLSPLPDWESLKGRIISSRSYRLDIVTKG